MALIGIAQDALHAVPVMEFSQVGLDGGFDVEGVGRGRFPDPVRRQDDVVAVPIDGDHRRGVMFDADVHADEELLVT